MSCANCRRLEDQIRLFSQIAEIEGPARQRLTDENELLKQELARYKMDERNLALYRGIKNLPVKDLEFMERWVRERVESYKSTPENPPMGAVGVVCGSPGGPYVHLFDDDIFNGGEFLYLHRAGGK